MSRKEQEIYEFGDFQFDIGKCALTRSGRPVVLQKKSFELLCLLVRSGGDLVTRDEVMDELWADTFVADNNLSQHICSLRKALGENGDASTKFIETVPRLGYRFVGDVRCLGAPRDLYLGQNGSSALTEPDDSIVPPASLPLHRNSVAALILGVLLLGAAATIFWQFFAGSRDDPSLPASDHRGLAARFERSISNKIADAQAGSISPNGKLVVFTQILNDRESLWIRHLESARTSMIGNRINGEYRVPLFSPDSESVYFLTPRTEAHRYDLDRVSVFGGAAVRIKEDIGAAYAVSAQTGDLAFVRVLTDRDECVLSISDGNGETERPIARRYRPNCYDLLQWAPDAKTIVSSVRANEPGDNSTEIIATEIEGGTEKHLTRERWLTIRDMAWLPGANVWLVTGRKSHGTDFNRLWYVDPKSANAVRISSETVNFNSISVSADGGSVVAKRVTLDSGLAIATADNAAGTEKRIVSAYGNLAWAGGKVYYRTSNEKALWAINPDGTGAQQIDGPAHVHISSSLDGKFIVSAKENGGRLDLWRMNAEGFDQTQLTFGGGAQRPVISPDNVWVYYQSTAGPKLSIWKVPLAGGEPALVIDHGASPSLSPDGMSLAYYATGKDDIIIFDLATQKPVRSFTLPEYSVSADRIQWAADSLGVYVGPENKARTGNIWLLSLRDGKAAKVTGFTSDRLFDFQFSPDQTMIAMNRGNWISEVVLIDLADPPRPN